MATTTGAARAERRLRDVFECDLAAYLVVTGTAANALALAACCPSHGAVVCHQEAHIHTDECGAPEMFTGGAKLLGVRGAAGKLTPAGVAAMLDTMGRGEHEQRPSVLSLSQATELGTVYTPARSTALAELARTRGLHVHMDGARFANALVRLGGTPAELTWQAGVDVLSFGATKNGALGVEAVIFFDRALADRLPLSAQARRTAGVEEPLPRRADARLPRRRPLAGQRRQANRMAAALAAGCRAIAGRAAAAPGGGQRGVRHRAHGPCTTP